MILSVSMMSMVEIDSCMSNYSFGLTIDKFEKNYDLYNFFELYYVFMMANEITLHD